MRLINIFKNKNKNKICGECQHFKTEDNKSVGICAWRLFAHDEFCIYKEDKEACGDYEERRGE